MYFCQMSTHKHSSSREDYLKAILSLQLKGEKANTSAIAGKLDARPASITGMFKTLSDLGLINYKKYEGATLTREGKTHAISLLRKHRLWETFMFEKLGFGWDEVHEVAEQLEHVDSQLLVNKLDAFLGHPAFDPHGDPIPDADGNIYDKRSLVPLNTLVEGASASIQGVLESSDEFLRHLDELKIKLGLVFKVTKVREYDGSFVVEVSGVEAVWSLKLVEQLLVEIK